MKERLLDIQIFQLFIYSSNFEESFTTIVARNLASSSYFINSENFNLKPNAEHLLDYSKDCIIEKNRT